MIFLFGYLETDVTFDLFVIITVLGFATYF